MTLITAWHKATSHIERDVRLSELTDAEIEAIVAAIREGQPMTKDDAIKAIERDAIVAWLREMHTKYHAFASPAVEADYETGKAMAFAEAANSIERGEHLHRRKRDGYY